MVFCFHFLSAKLQEELGKLYFSSWALCIPFTGDILVLSSPISCVAFQRGGHPLTWLVSDSPDVLGSVLPVPRCPFPCLCLDMWTPFCGGGSGGWGRQNPAPRPLADLGWQEACVWWWPQSFSCSLGLILTLINSKITDSFVAWMHLVFDQYLRAKTTCPEISLKELHRQMVIKFVCGLLPLSQHTIQGESLLSSSSRWWSESDWGDT